MSIISMQSSNTTDTRHSPPENAGTSRGMQSQSNFCHSNGPPASTVPVGNTHSLSRATAHHTPYPQWTRSAPPHRRTATPQTHLLSVLNRKERCTSSARDQTQEMTANKQTDGQEQRHTEQQRGHRDAKKRDKNKKNTTQNRICGGYQREAGISEGEMLLHKESKNR